MTAKINAPKRGRPRSFDADKTVDIVKDLFYKQGFDAVGVAEISKATGLNPPSLYSAFGSKYQLLERAVERYATTETGWVEDALAAATSPEALMETIFRSAAEAYTRSPDALGCLALEATRNSANDEARALTETYAERTWRMIRDRLAALGAADPGALADYVQMVMRGLSASARAGMARDALMKVAGMAAGAVPPSGKS